MRHTNNVQDTAVAFPGMTIRFAAAMTAGLAFLYYMVPVIGFPLGELPLVWFWQT